MPRMEPHDVTFSASPAELRACLEADRAPAGPLWIDHRLKARGLRRPGAAGGAHGQASGREVPVRA